MRMVLGLCVVVAIGLGTLARASQQPGPVPDDFAIRFEYGLCTTDVLDTFKGVFLRDMGPREAAISVPLVLPDESRRAIYAELMTAKFSDYPEVFHVQGNIGFGPAMHYKLETQINGVRHSVSWSDGSKPSTPAADRLRNLFTKIISFIANEPAVQQLPTARVGCQ